MGLTKKGKGQLIDCKNVPIPVPVPVPVPLYLPLPHNLHISLLPSLLQYDF